VFLKEIKRADPIGYQRKAGLYQIQFALWCTEALAQSIERSWLCYVPFQEQSNIHCHVHLQRGTIS
jgi:hypothetical protein